MPKVYNKHHKNVPKDAVYVGRPSMWGNPFSHKKNTAAQAVVPTRQDAVDAYRYMVEQSPELQEIIKLELKGKDLVCWCAPAACHADVLLEFANKEEEPK